MDQPQDTTISEQEREQQHRRLIAFLALFLMFAVGLQTFHVVEHTTQMIQKFVLDMDSAHGLVGQLDLEIVHFLFNAFYLGCYGVVLYCWMRVGREISVTYRFTTAILFVGLLSQSYHMVEHVVRFIQHLETGQQGTPGLIGNRFQPVIAHFLLNTLVEIPVLWAYFHEGFHIRVYNMLPRQLARKWA